MTTLLRRLSLAALLLGAAWSAPADAKGAARKAVTINIGGEGEARHALNVNPNHLTSTVGEPGRPIPNLVPGRGEALPFGDHSVNKTIVRNAPITDGTAHEIARVTTGRISLLHPADYATTAHQRVIDLVHPKSVKSRRIKLGDVPMRYTTIRLAN